MAKVTDLSELNAAPASGDVLPIVDVSDTTHDASGTTKYVTTANLQAGVGVTAALSAGQVGSAASSLAERIEWASENVFFADAYGAGTDKTAAQNYTGIQAAITAASAVGGVVRFGPGVYEVQPSGGAGSGSVFDLLNVDDVAIMGAGLDKTIIRLAAGDYSTGSDPHVFDLEECNNWVFQNLTIDGNRSNLTGTQEQMHAIEWRQGGDSLYVDNVRFFNTKGDGIRFLGRTIEPTYDAIVTNCVFDDCGRSGVTFQHDANRVIIANNIFKDTSDQDIDMEPTSGLGPYDVIITGNVISHTTSAYSVTLTGVNAAGFGGRMVFSNNIVYGGSVRVFIVDGLTFTGNQIHNVDNGGGAHTRQALDCNRLVTNAIIANNYIVNDQTTQAVRFKRDATGTTAENVIVTGNLIVQNAASGGVTINDMQNMKFESNILVGAGSGVGLNFSNTVDNSAAKFGIQIVNNHIRNWAIGVNFSTFNTTTLFADVLIASNQFTDDQGTPTLTEAININAESGTRYITNLAVLGNQYGSSVTETVDLPVGFAYYQSGENQYTGTGSPESVLTAPVGTLFLRTDGGASTTLYVKESGTGNTGWAAK